VYETYLTSNLRYSQMAPIDMYEERNTGNNLPAEIKISAIDGDAYKFLFMAKGGGSANKSYLFQETKAVLNRSSMLRFLDEKLRTLGTAACPPYHLAVVIGGTSAEFALKTAKYASAHYLDNLPTEGSMSAHGFRDLELEEEVFKLTQSFGIGAQFGGKYFCHDVRVVRLPRHGASCPVAIAVSCSADRQALGKITAEGVFLEQLETDPAHYLPDTEEQHLIQGGEVVKVDLTQPMSDILATLSQHPVKTRLSLTGPLVVARDIAHAKIQERLNAGEEMPQYLKDHPVYYAGPAKTPKGFASGSFGPTTAGRMDSYVKSFQGAGGSLVMLAKGNRSKKVTEACNEHGGFYLGSIGGPAARLAQDCIKSVEVLEYPELGMEAVWKIEVEDFPAFVVVDDKGNDFFQNPAPEPTFTHIPVRGPGL
jgi:fumarate hydratase class I